MNKKRYAALVGYLMLATLLLILAGCSKKKSSSVADVNRALKQAKDECASVYASGELSAMQPKVDEMNQLAEKGKNRKAGKKALPLIDDLQSVRSKASAGRADAKMKSESAMADARKAMEAADRAEASKYASNDYRSASSKFKMAESKASDPCSYAEATRLAREAKAAADRAATSAVAGKRRQEEDARRAADAEKARREAEARRLADEAARRKPTTYKIVKGNHLWAIAGMDKIYGDPREWPLLYDANRSKIKNPDLVYPDQELSIPRAMTEAQKRAKLAELWKELGQGSSW